ncbi:MAG: alpha/beta fold hydrolase [Pseudomonadota bacterium]
MHEPPVLLRRMRGEGSYNSQALLDALRSLSHGERVADDLQGPYRRFYAADQFSIPVQCSMVCLDVTVDGRSEQVVVHQFLPDRIEAWALLTPGWTDHVGLFGYAIEFFLRQGVAVIAYDQIGHGLSSGQRATIADFDHYVQALDVVHRWARETHGFAWCHWIGQSMGGSVTLEYLQQYPQEQIGEVVLFAPLVRPYMWWLNRWVFAVAKLTIEARPLLIKPNTEGAEFLQLRLNDPLQPHDMRVQWVQAMVNWFRRFERYPVASLAPKVLQGYADRTVSWRHSVQVLGRRYPGTTWHMMPKAQHHLVNEAPELRESMWQWLAARCVWTAPVTPE